VDITNPGVQYPHWTATFLDEGLLNGMQFVSIRQPFDRGDFALMCSRCGDQATEYRQAIHVKRAGTAFTFTTADLGTVRPASSRTSVDKIEF
jgi:hypothetical protein